jgi:hypothetical protein
MQNLIVKSRKVQLDGNAMTGDTYPIKQWIKTYLSGKWDAASKSWIVDLGQVEQWTGTCIKIDDSPAQAKQSANGTARWNGWCNKCHSYCWGDCTANS